MTKENFPSVAVLLGVVFAILVYFGRGTGEDGRTFLPLLLLLLVCEFGGIVTAAGAFLGARQMLMKKELSSIGVTLFCILLCLQFLFHGLQLYPK